MLKMYSLARKRSKARTDEEKPRQQFGPIFRRAHEASDLVPEIKQDSAGIKHTHLATAWIFGVDNRRNLPIGIDGAKIRSMLLTLAGIDRHHLIRQTRLFKEQGHLEGVWSRVEIEADHLGLPYEKGRETF